MIEKIETSQIQDFLEKSSPKPPNSAGASFDDSVGASLRVNYASLIDKAIKTPEADAKAVKRAQELLLSGQLDSPENIREAAKNIIKFGI
jgi:hypothetical protein